MATRLEEWFHQNRRDLPWRGSPEPYHILVAEVMLQQTTMAAVVPYYKRFIQRFPTLEWLALAPEEDVLSVWAGLGYYARGRNLHQAAKILMEQGGEVPSDLDALLALPGIGPYTAGAIRSIAFDLPAPVVDANVRRVLGRVLALPPEAADAEQQITQATLEFTGAGSPCTISQGLMEIGSLVCSIESPQCPKCPLNQECRAHRQGSYTWFGSVRKKREQEVLQQICLLAEFQGQVLLGRPTDGRWKGLWEFPRGQFRPNDLPIPAADRRLRQLGLSARGFAAEGLLRHTVTRYDITLHIIRCELLAPPEAENQQFRLVAPEELASVALPSPMRRIARSYYPVSNARDAHAQEALL